MAAKTVAAGVRADLAALGAEKTPGCAGLAASALALARELDGSTSATSKSMCARALIDTLNEIRALVPPAEERDAVDELAGKRSERLARLAGS